MKANRELLKWFWRTSKPYRFQSCLNAFVGVLRVAVDFAFIASTKMAIDIATGKNDSSLNIAVALIIGCMMSQISITFSRKWISALLGVKAQNKMQQRLFARLLKSEWNGKEIRHSGDVLNRLEKDVTDITNVITETLPSALAVIVRMGGAFLYLYSMAPTLACLILIIVPIFSLLSKLYVKKMRQLTREIRNTDSIIQSILTESIQHRIVLKTLERTGTMISRLEDRQSTLREQVRHRTVFSSTSGLVLNIGFGAGYLLTFVWGVKNLEAGVITYGMMTAFIQLVGQIQGPFRDIVAFVPIIVNSFTAAERLIELEEAPLEEEGEPIRMDEGAGIRITDVSFAYNEKKREILSHLTHDFRPGTTTAILGETGAGKTTLIRLILALLQPSQGSVEIYPANQSDQNKDTYTQTIAHKVSPLTRCNMVYVPQGNTLFSGTIRDNLLLGNPHATDEDIRQALKCACADFVLSRPDGLDALCGEMGAGMSEGQAQRISIARALLRKGSILLLDEATSALDIETEKRLLQNLANTLNGKRTIIFITHRPAIVDYCDEVLTLKRS